MIEVAPAVNGELAAVRRLVEAAGLPLDGLGDVPTEVVVVRDGVIVGVAALEIHGVDGLLRSVAVADERRGEGIGGALVSALEAHAAELGLHGIYLLTETVPEFFARRGYEVILRSGAPPAIAASVEWAVACGESAVPMSLALT